MKWFCIALAMAVLCVASQALSLDAIDGIVDTAVAGVDQVSAPVNRVLKKVGLSKCDKTVDVTKYIGKCIPAHLQCIGVDVLDKLTKTLVNIPACKGKRKHHRKIVLQQQQQQQSAGRVVGQQQQQQQES